MDASITIDVTTLDLAHRQALEDVIGTRLHEGQRLVIGVTQSDRPASGPARKPTIEDWAKVYEGLTEQQIEEIDRIAKTRANLTRNVP
jgi:hypothetical protein